MKVEPIMPVYKMAGQPWRNPQQLYTVEVLRTRHGVRYEETAAFVTFEGAREWAGTMLSYYGYQKAWINGAEYTGE